MANKAGDVIKQWGRYRIQHYQQHKKDSLKNFKPETIHTLPVCFPRCENCPAGYPLYTMTALIIRGK